MKEKISREMMEYMNLLKEVDTKGVEPLTHIFEGDNVFREDMVTGSDRSEEILANAPFQKEGMFVVPKTVG